MADPALAPTVPGELPTAPSERRVLPRALMERYEDLELIGEGGMGTVYRGRDPRLGRSVAIKLLKGDDPEMGRRFITEARAQAKIQHEHVCRVYEAGQAGGEPYIAMQLIAGEPLSKIAEQLNLGQRVKVMREVSSAVHEAHRLGMIHRDIKPANILIERADDGSYKPYVMDFGLAREVEEKGETRTGVIVGTPAYMPPEQAKGDIRAMDRRSDVYSLGATLYDIIAGRPPFIAEHPWKLLLMVAYEEAPPLRRFATGVPRDLETIVMKCLEREPDRRYDSARALAEDLQHFLDGEPISGKRASLGYVLWKKVKKHRAAAIFSAICVVAGLVVSILWVRAGRRAAEQAKLAQALGEDVKEMELFLRNAYGMPLHDVERERDVVRARLAEIEHKMAELGPVGEGPGQYALGRGALALGDVDTAREHLEMALQKGYSSPELSYALGRALGELLRVALEESLRITNEEERKRKVAEIHARLRDPALKHLREAQAARLSAPEHVEGLIALYAGDHELAIQRAREAFEKAPWMYEAKKLEGDALYAMGSKYRHDAAFDYDKMMERFAPAAKAYAEASDAARSDPDAHRAECELWEKVGWAASMRSLPFDAPFQTARAACERAVKASSKDGKARLQQALLLSARLRAVQRQGMEPNAQEVEEAVHAAEEAKKVRPADPMAAYAVGRAWMYRARSAVAAERRPSVEAAIGAYLEAARLDPSFTWAVNELGQAYVFAAELDLTAGRDPRSAVLAAVQKADEASRLDPAFSLAADSKVQALSLRLEAELFSGKSTDETVELLSAAVLALEQRAGPGAWGVTYWKAKSHVLRGKHELSLGKDPALAAASAREVIQKAGPDAARDPWFAGQIAEGLLLVVAYSHRNDRSAQPVIKELRTLLSTLITDPSSVPEGWHDVAAGIELAATREAILRGEPPGDGPARALGFLAPVLSKGGDNPAFAALAADASALEAQALARAGKDPEHAVTPGLKRAEEALRINPHLAAALATKGALLAVRARSAKDPRARAEALDEAKAALDAARRENPRLWLPPEATAPRAAQAAR